MTAQLLAARPKIKILLYTDDPTAITDGKNLLGLGSMIERLKAHAPVFADTSVKWLSRSSDDNHHADNKLDRVMRAEVAETGEPFDEIWFFGLHQANTTRFSLGVYRGGPDSELTPGEVDELEKWMNAQVGSGGGVLMTGDHANPVPPNWLRNTNGRCADAVKNPELLGLGRAIGRCVPRAGELRKWDGPPSSRAEDAFNTLGNLGLQTDRVPQHLLLERFGADGEPDPHGHPHPLFFYRPGDSIDVFPDHRHEGALVNPDLSNKLVWPVGPTKQPKPCFVAFGTDKQTGATKPLVTAYDGDPAGVGRIVADSSWHHYVNINLTGFPHPAPIDSPSDKISQFYGNLLVWLAPLHKRRQMAETMYREIANYTLLLEQHGNPVQTGETAYSVLGRSTSPCEIHELLRASGEAQVTTASSSTARTGQLAMTEQQALGAVLDSYQREMIRAEEETFARESSALKNMASEEMPRASAAAVGVSRAALEVTNRPLKPGGQTVVATMTEPKEWTIQMKRDARAGEEPTVAILVFNLNIQNEVITGDVCDSDGQCLSAVTGTNKALPREGQSWMTLEFEWAHAHVALSGIAEETGETVLFNGRFTVTASVPPVSRDQTGDGTVQLMAPGDGDTGSGTGQQT